MGNGANKCQQQLATTAIYSDSVSKLASQKKLQRRKNKLHRHKQLYFKQHEESALKYL